MPPCSLHPNPPAGVKTLAHSANGFCSWDPLRRLRRQQNPGFSRGPCVILWVLRIRDPVLALMAEEWSWTRWRKRPHIKEKRQKAGKTRSLSHVDFNPRDPCRAPDPQKPDNNCALPHTNTAVIKESSKRNRSG